MDTKKCMVLLSVIDSLNITEASRRLGYTPSGVSRIIESLEKEMGFPLFIRSHDGVRPTTEWGGFNYVEIFMTAVNKSYIEIFFLKLFYYGFFTSGVIPEEAEITAYYKSIPLFQASYFRCFESFKISVHIARNIYHNVKILPIFSVIR